ncbi:hypothetical protein CB0940_04487 [Cercospora beticola]|uniref:Uncharacterized protein n=1 Tax=Cercospora beticola TaxID=122368 RepID=A0A2G5HJL5_CERBT|nr:hypothetical protein CB0940_04487 [Cercospora beticola]PIA92757.1 hypothetical protein CB0940_04487 [Cercospora beticola]WPB01732.1 hypothetical protein RHO25_006363 [Cercospora beticola]CAK1363451.1 unnamed protein product [Cercospora beticola]
MKPSLLSLVALSVSSTSAVPITRSLSDHATLPLIKYRNNHSSDPGDVRSFACRKQDDLIADTLPRAPPEADKMELGHTHQPCSMKISKGDFKRQDPKVELVALQDMLTQLLDTILKPAEGRTPVPTESPHEADFGISTEHGGDIGSQR